MSKFQKCSKLFAKVSRSVLGWFFRKKIMHSVPWRVEFSKIFKKIYIQKSKKPGNCSQKCPNVFWTCFGANFLENFCPVFRGVSSLPKFSKKLKKCQISKNVQNCSQKCPNVFWTCFGANFLENSCPVFHGGSSPLNFENSRKSLKNPKMSIIVPKSVEKCFRMIFSKKIYAQCSMEGRVFENFQKKIIQKSKKAENCSQKCPNVFWTCFGAFSWKVSWPVFHGGSRPKIFKKNLKNVKIPKMLKIVRKSVQKCFGVIFSKKIYAQCSMEGRVFENFQKKYIQKSKKAGNCSQKCPNVFWTCFGANFLENFCTVFRGLSSLPKFSKKT